MTAIPTYENVADVEAAAQRMRAFYATGATLDVAYRRRALEQMRAYLKANEERVLAALTADLGKAPFEGYATELGLVYDEINTCVRHLSKWARPRRVPTPLVHFHSTSKVYPSPLGVVLVWQLLPIGALTAYIGIIYFNECLNFALSAARLHRAVKKYAPAPAREARV